MNKLIVCWIIENDDDVWKLSYNSVKDVADNMVLIDGNKEYNSSRYEGAGVFRLHSPYPHDKKGCYSIQRNVALDYLKKNHDGDWVLMLDADEFVDYPDRIKPFVEELEKADTTVCSPLMRHFIGTLGKEDALYPEGQDRHYVPHRFFKIRNDVFYPENYHPVLSGFKEGERVALGSPFTVWHIGYARQTLRIHQKYKTQLQKSTSHTKEFLEWWYIAHLLGEFPTKDVPAQTLPQVLLNFLDVPDSLYFRNRGLEAKHFVDAHNWKEYFKPTTALEYGCGLGHRVYAMHVAGIKSTGVELSEWAVKKCPYKEHIRMIQGNILDDGVKARFDLVVAYDVLEHLDQEDIPKALSNMFDSTDDYILVSIPFEGDPNLYNDGTHKTFRPRSWWEEQVQDAGFDVVSVPEHFLFKHQLVIGRKK